MSNKMLVTLRMDQRLQMSQQLRQAITLLQYNTLDLKQLVRQYIDTNPLIELEESEKAEETEVEAEHEQEAQDDAEIDNDFTDYSADWARNRQYREDESALENVAKPQSLRENLLAQTLHYHFSDEEQILAEAIIDAVDEQGFLSMPITEIHQVISTELSVTLDQLEDVLKTVQGFDPIGVATYDLRECLLVQLRMQRLQNPDFDLAYQIIRDYYGEYCDHQVKVILKKMHITLDDFNRANEVVRHLNLHPASQYINETNIYIEPELYVKKIKNTWHVFLADSILTDLKINKQYQNIIKEHRKHGSYKSMKQELDEAKALLTGLKRRNETLLSVAKYIIEMQSDFLDHGLTYMKPMNIVDVSQALNLHESTVSRVTSGKYIATPRGIFELKYFFPSQVATAMGPASSDIAVKEHIREMIQNETRSRPYSDADIVLLLKQKGINLARRTVAKYREAINILPSYQRSRVADTSES